MNLAQLKARILAGERFHDVIKSEELEPGSQEYTELFELARKHFERNRESVKHISLAHKAVNLDDDDERPGHLVAVFSTFNVVDDEGDMILPGAIEEKKGVPFTYAHDWTKPSYGKGDIRLDPDRAIWDGYLFVEDMQSAAEVFASIKNMGDSQQYSWSFFIKDAEIVEDEDQPWGFRRDIKATDMIEVCAGIRGVNQQTYTLLAKSQPQYIVDPTFYGTLIAPSVNSDPVPKLENDGKKSRSFDNQIQDAQAAIEDLVERASSLAEMRAKDGRTISQANLDLLAGLTTSLEAACVTLRGLTTPEPEPEFTVPEPDSKSDAEVRALLKRSFELMHDIPSQ